MAQVITTKVVTATDVLIAATKHLKAGITTNGSIDEIFMLRSPTNVS